MDLDDTLLNKENIITEYSKNIINSLRSKGYLFIFNTARSYLATSSYIIDMEPDYSILNGGTLILDKDMNIIHKEIIDPIMANEIINMIKADSYVTNFSVQSETGLYTRDLDYVRINGLALYNSFDEPICEGVYKIMLATTEKLKYIKYAEKNGLDFESYFNGIWCRVAKGNKYLGNLWLFNYLKDDNPMDYVFGDDTGDSLMIKNAYHGVYLINSDPKIRYEGANVTRYDSDSDGACRYLEDLLLRNGECL